MKHALIALIAATLAVPVISVPTVSDAQTARSSMRIRAPRVTREDRILNLVGDAEERLAEIEDEILEITEAGEAAGGLTAAQQRQLERLNERRDREQREIARLNATLES